MPARRYASDVTGDAAVADVSGDSLLAEVLARIEGERDRVLVLAHVGLDISLRSLARELGTSSDDLAVRLSGIVTQLQNDAQLISRLDGINRAGRTEQYQALAFRFGLQDWFCSYCGQFMVQPERGNRRKTCSDRCRSKLSRARGIGWKNQPGEAPGITAASAVGVGQRVVDERARRDVLAGLLPPIKEPTGWRPSYSFQEAALLLLAFTCRNPSFSAVGLSRINTEDVIRTPKGLEILLPGRAARAKWYVTIPADEDRLLCPVRAMSDWQGVLKRERFDAGPLFSEKAGYWNSRFPRHRLTSGKIRQIIKNSMYRCDVPRNRGIGYVQLAASDSLPEFLDDLTLRIHGQ